MQGVKDKRNRSKERGIQRNRKVEEQMKRETEEQKRKGTRRQRDTRVKETEGKINEGAARWRNRELGTER